MTNLTEQWKKGELPSGWYYVRLIRGEYRIDLYINGKNERIDCPDNIIDTVVCEVPSYEKWQETLQALDAAHKAIKMEDETINRLVSSGKQCNCENGKLKDVLKECYGLFNRSTVDGEEPNNGELIMILTKIEEVLK